MPENPGFDYVEECHLAAQDRFLGQARLKGMWVNFTEGCPHLIKRPDVNRCSINDCRACRYELDETCDVFRQILAEWKEEYLALKGEKIYA